MQSRRKKFLKILPIPRPHIKKKFITGVTSRTLIQPKKFKRRENFSHRTRRHEFLYSRRYQNRLLSLFITYYSITKDHTHNMASHQTNGVDALTQRLGTVSSSPPHHLTKLPS